LVGRIAGQALEGKARKYNDHCHDDKAKGSRSCLRRMQHILRAVKFISKASSEGVLASMSLEDQAEIQKESQLAQDLLGQSMMSEEKMQLFKRLVVATNKDEHGLRTAPIATIKKTLLVLEGLLIDDKQAFDKLKELENPELKQPAVPENVAEMAAEIQENPSNIVENIDGPAQSLDDAVNADNANATKFEGSLVQLRDGETAVKWIGFVAIAALLVLSLMYIGGVIVTVLLVWVASSLFGCAGWTLGRYSMAKELGETQNGVNSTRKFGSCVASFISAPFRYIFKAVKTVAPLFRRKEVASDSKATDARKPGDGGEPVVKPAVKKQWWEDSNDGPAGGGSSAGSAVKDTQPEWLQSSGSAGKETQPDWLQSSGSAGKEKEPEWLKSSGSAGEETKPEWLKAN